jgi:hypothetical protein
MPSRSKKSSAMAGVAEAAVSAVAATAPSAIRAILPEASRLVLVVIEAFLVGAPRAGLLAGLKTFSAIRGEASLNRDDRLY